MEFEMISGRQLEQFLLDKSAFVIDLRSPEEYQRFHIPGAVNIPYSRLKQCRQFPTDLPLIFYCERGSISLIAAREMASEGYRTKTLSGGVSSWHKNLK